MVDFETVLYEEQGPVAWVTLNRPEVHNAFNSTMMRELQEVWRSVRTNESVRVVVLTGSGERAFCTGIDRGEQIGGDGDRLIGSHDTPFHFDDPGDYIGPKSNDCWKPVIAAVNGMACGGAFYMLGEVEFLIAAEHATFFDPHVTYGMVAAFEPVHLLQKMPFPEIMRLSLLGASERVSAQRAYEVGLVSQVVASAELRDAAAWAAGEIAAAPARAVQGTVRALWTGLELSRGHALDQMYGYVAMGTDPQSIEEGQRRFASGRRVEWRVR
ncbi:MAG: Enoyl-CoA-hydratase [Acidimicrobiales bacterium]|nr:Enoyl-CoA-hydratase [Acidimicrobiales bacterium]